MRDTGPFPSDWFYTRDEVRTQIQPWFPLPANMINKGEEWIPEIQQKATVRSNYPNRTSISTPIFVALRFPRDVQSETIRHRFNPMRELFRNIGSTSENVGSSCCCWRLRCRRVRMCLIIELQRSILVYSSINRLASTVYISFTQGIPPDAESLFNLPDQWPTYCGNANTGNSSIFLWCRS